MESCPGTRARRAGDGKHMWRFSASGERPLENRSKMSRLFFNEKKKRRNKRTQFSVLFVLVRSRPLAGSQQKQQQRGKRRSSFDLTLTLKWKHVFTFRSSLFQSLCCCLTHD